MAVPLVDKGVVVVAVGYDIAPKGRIISESVQDEADRCLTLTLLYR